LRTDGYRGYARLAASGYEHHARVLASGDDIDEWLPWSHIVLANFKRWLLDIFHGVSPAHLQAYLDEFCYRLNRRGERPRPLPSPSSTAACCTPSRRRIRC